MALLAYWHRAIPSAQHLSALLSLGYDALFWVQERCRFAASAFRHRLVCVGRGNVQPILELLSAPKNAARHILGPAPLRVVLCGPSDVGVRTELIAPYPPSDGTASQNLNSSEPPRGMPFGVIDTPSGARDSAGSRLRLNWSTGYQQFQGQPEVPYNRGSPRTAPGKGAACEPRVRARAVLPGLMVASQVWSRSGVSSRMPWSPDTETDAYRARSWCRRRS